ncbi:hypothetical protein D9M68_659000 [compost metagenome]
MQSWDIVERIPVLADTIVIKLRQVKAIQKEQGPDRLGIEIVGTGYNVHQMPAVIRIQKVDIFFMY